MRYLLLTLLAALLGWYWLGTGNETNSEPLGPAEPTSTNTDTGPAPVATLDNAIQNTDRSTEKRAQEPKAPLVNADTNEAAPGHETLSDWLQSVRPEVFKALEGKDPKTLEELDLRGAEITDEDLYWIGQLTQLKILSLYGNPITDAGLAQLSGLLNLERIILRGTEVAGPGLNYLPTQSLQHLHLCNSKVGQAILSSTPPMPEIRTLKLNFLDFEDSFVESLNVYPKMEHLEIDRSQLTDMGLERLLELNPQLRRIELRNTNVTNQGIAAMQALYPNCEFVTG